MKHSAINLKEKLAKFSEHWSPKIIARMNDYHFKLAKFRGDFVWHSHHDTDETFIVLDGEMRIDFRYGKVDLKPGEMFIVPKVWSISPSLGTNARSCWSNPPGRLIPAMRRAI